MKILNNKTTMKKTDVFTIVMPEDKALYDKVWPLVAEKLRKEGFKWNGGYKIKDEDSPLIYKGFNATANYYGPEKLTITTLWEDEVKLEKLKWSDFLETTFEDDTTFTVNGIEMKVVDGGIEVDSRAYTKKEIQVLLGAAQIINDRYEHGLRIGCQFMSVSDIQVILNHIK